MTRPYPVRPTTCHPDRRHVALGLCSACWRRQYRVRHPITAEQRTRYRAAEKVRYRETGGEKWIRNAMRQRYNISADEYDRMLAAQGGVYALCRAPETATRQGTPLRLAVDHDHACCPGKRSCGKCVRALLCTACNRGLAAFRDNPHLLRQAAEYVAQNLTQQSTCVPCQVVA